VAPRSDGVPRTAKYQAALEGGHDVLVLISEVWGGFSPRRCASWASYRRHGTTASTSSARAAEHDVVDVIVHLLPRPAALAGGAVGGRDRDRAGDQEERELIECARRTRDSSTALPPARIYIRCLHIWQYIHMAVITRAPEEIILSVCRVQYL
jgi:hypothetical protein